ncbi:MAG: acyl-CoA dehydrogenase family protein, partial [Acidimicrobiia bacterium]|nr:acyl-CoA dehydrogenase family protein [Acidimicrobiia bacterium]
MADQRSDDEPQRGDTTGAGVSVQTLALDAILDDRHPEKVKVADWANEALVDPTLDQRDDDCEFWPEGWRRCADYGIQGLIIPEDLGGHGLDLITAMLRFEGLGLGCADGGLVFGLSSQIWTMQMALDRFGTDEQRRRYLPRLADGSAIGAFAMSEPGSGSDAFALTTSAEAIDGGYRLNGTKAWVSLGPVSDVIMVFATIDPSLGRWGVTTFLVDADTPGVEIQPNRPKMGLRTTPFADVVFTDCIVPSSARVGAEGAGAAIFSTAMETERAFLLAGSVGRLERQIADTVAYANDRTQFGQAIGAFQSVSHEIADMKFAHETARLMLYKATVLQQRGTPSMM